MMGYPLGASGNGLLKVGLNSLKVNPLPRLGGALVAILRIASLKVNDNIRTLDSGNTALNAPDLRLSCSVKSQIAYLVKSL